MSNLLFTNARIFDGSGEHPYTGEVPVQGNRIKHVGCGSRTALANGHTVTDAARTYWEWRSAFKSPPDQEAELAALVGEQIDEAGFDAIERASGQPVRPRPSRCGPRAHVSSRRSSAAC